MNLFLTYTVSIEISGKMLQELTTFDEYDERVEEVPYLAAPKLSDADYEETLRFRCEYIDTDGKIFDVNLTKFSTWTIDFNGLLCIREMDWKPWVIPLFEYFHKLKTDGYHYVYLDGDLTNIRRDNLMPFHEIRDMDFEKLYPRARTWTNVLLTSQFVQSYDISHMSPFNISGYVNNKPLSWYKGNKIPYSHISSAKRKKIKQAYISMGFPADKYYIRTYKYRSSTRYIIEFRPYVEPLPAPADASDADASD